MFSEDVFKKYKEDEHINWSGIFCNEDVSEQFIEKYIDFSKLYWSDISDYQKLSESFIEKYHDKLNWGYMSYSQKLSESFIEKYHYKLNWDYISYYQKLSENFIEDNINKVNLSIISYSQKLSDDFCNKYGIRSNILNVIHNCGKFNRRIVIFKHYSEIIHIGCFKGTKDEAIDAIRKKYCLDELAMNEYIAKVEECFNY